MKNSTKSLRVRSPKVRAVDPIKHIFYADISKGFIIKTMIEVLCSPLIRGVFQLTRKGIVLTQNNESNTILFNITLPRDNFKRYVCNEEKIINVNLSHMKNQLKNVKKKDSLVLSIRADNPGYLFMTIKPEVPKQQLRTETVHIVYKEEIDHEPVQAPDEGYNYPIVIQASDFQKIKRQITMGAKSINVVTQGTNYISFSCSADIYGTDLEVGEWIDTDKYESSRDESQTKSNEGNDNEIDLEYSEDGEIYTVYESSFPSSMFNMLLKLPGLCTQMKFYAPSIPNYPLKMSIEAAQQSCTLGHIDVFIKNDSVIALELSNNTDRPKKRKSKK